MENLNITIKLTPDNIKEIIIDYLKRNKGYNVDPKNIQFNVYRSLEGYGPMEHEVNKFDGCNVDITNIHTEAI